MKKKITQYISQIKAVYERQTVDLIELSLRNFSQWAKSHQREQREQKKKDFVQYMNKIWKKEKVILFYKKCIDAFDHWESQQRQWEDPITVVNTRPTKASESDLPDILSKAEIEHFLSQIHKTEHYLMMAMAYGAWLKVSEIVWLTIWSIDTASNTIICDRWQPTERMTPLPERIRSSLTEWIQDKESEEYLFPGRAGTQRTTRSVQYLFKKYLKKSQITKKISINALRHSFAVHLLQQWVDIQYVQRLLGHKNSRTTAIYKKFLHAPLQHIQSPL